MGDKREWAVEGLKRNRVVVDTQERTIWLDKRKTGIKVWAMVDCLCKHYNYMWVWQERGYG